MSITPAMSIQCMLLTAARCACAVAMLSMTGCARSGSSDARAPWPYAGVVTPPGLPAELDGRSVFAGRWIAADPYNNRILTETGEAQFLASFSFDAPRRYALMDLGVGAEVENVAFVENGDLAILVGAVNNFYDSRAVFARSILQIDLTQNTLIDAIAISRDGIARGFAVDDHSRRAYLLDDDGEGRGTVQIIDLYGGRTRAAASSGFVPRGVLRKGLAVNRNAQYVFCLSGGESARSDFAPIHDDEPEAPSVVVMDTDSLGVVARTLLPPRYEPLAVVYDESRDRIYVLESDGNRGLIVILDGAFFERRAEVSLPEVTTDLVVQGGYAFCPGATGIYVVDLDMESLVSRPAVTFGLTGEIVVSEELDTAFVLFQSASAGGLPGIAQIALQTGNVVNILQ